MEGSGFIIQNDGFHFIDGMSRKDQWQFLYKWASSFRANNNLTAKQFLNLIGLPSADWYSIYLYTHSQPVLLDDDGPQAELLIGLIRVYKSLQPVSVDILVLIVLQCKGII